MALHGSRLVYTDSHYIMLPSFSFPSRIMSLASFTLAAMKLLPPERGVGI